VSSPRITRRSFASVAFVSAAAAVVASPALRAQARPERSRVHIGVAHRGALSALPLAIAEQLGYFRSAGVDVDVHEFGSSPRVLQEALAGHVDVASGGFEQAVLAQARGHAMQAFVLQARAPQVAVGVSTRRVPGYFSISDLRGRRIGVTSAGSSTSLVAGHVLARGGLAPSDVRLVPIGNAWDALLALRMGEVDALSNTDPVMTQLELRSEVRIIGDTRTLKGTREVFGGLMPASCLFASQEYVARHPVTCQALAHGIVHALKWLQTAGPSDIIRTVPEPYMMGDRALYLAAFTRSREAISPDGLIPEHGVQTALRAVAFADPSLRVDAIAPARTFTNEFARRSKVKFNA
jgi:NitT/TauT family transport system substrate-binding protein